MTASKTLPQRQITATDAKIDRLVYELCDLTEEEIVGSGGRHGRPERSPLLSFRTSEALGPPEEVSEVRNLRFPSAMRLGMTEGRAVWERHRGTDPSPSARLHGLTEE